MGTVLNRLQGGEKVKKIKLVNLSLNRSLEFDSFDQMLEVCNTDEDGFIHDISLIDSPSGYIVIFMPTINFPEENL